MTGYKKNDYLKISRNMFIYIYIKEWKWYKRYYKGLKETWYIYIKEWLLSETI